MLVSAPLGGLTSAPELLPTRGVRSGQFLPEGANGRLLRSSAFFDGAGAGTATVVLVCWVAAGAALIVIDARRRRSTSASS